MGDLAYPVAIRGHHLLCLLGFRGLGYSEEFVARMEEVAGKFRSDATVPITVLAGCDIICAACPHNKGNRCRKKAGSESRVRAKDLAVLRRLGFTPGAEISVGSVWQRIKERLTPGDIAKLCWRCQWRSLGYCAEGLEKLVTAKST